MAYLYPKHKKGTGISIILSTNYSWMKGGRSLINKCLANAKKLARVPWRILRSCKAWVDTAQTSQQKYTCQEHTHNGDNFSILHILSSFYIISGCTILLKVRICLSEFVLILKCLWAKVVKLNLSTWFASILEWGV